MTTKKLFSFHDAFEKLHAIHKILICLVIAITTYLFIDIRNIAPLTKIMIGWNTFSLLMLIMTWITFKITTTTEIRKQAGLQDSSRLVIFIIVLITTTAGFFAILLLVISKNQKTESLDIPVAITGMILSWFLIHSVFAMRYALIYYGDHKTNPGVHTGGLVFPNEDKPDYLDFAYFSFIVGMTFQVSDVVITIARLRKLVLLHSILAFGFNTVIVALTINVIAGLRG